MHLKFFLALLLVFSVFSGCEKDPGSTPPPQDTETTACFTQKQVDDEIIFTNCSKNAGEYLWDFGDGSDKSIEESPKHKYSSNKTYTVTLRATGKNGSKTISNNVEYGYYCVECKTMRGDKDGNWEQLDLRSACGTKEETTNFQQGYTCPQNTDVYTYACPCYPK